MLVTELEIRDWRNYEDLRLSLYDTLNIFIGDNGQGKTNLLESIYYLCYGKNFRGNKEKELIHWNRNYFRLQAMFREEEDSRMQHLEIYYDAVRRKLVRLNGVKYSRVSQLPSRLSAVLFTPDDLAIIKGGPAQRRQFIDRELESLFFDFETLRLHYERVLYQRSELLRDIRKGSSSKSLLIPWNLQLVDLGVKILRKRIDLLTTLVPQARKIHAFLIGKNGNFNVTYQSSLGDVVHKKDDVIKQHFLNLLAELEPQEIAKGQNLVGPHRDDVVFYENGVDLRTYGSQGQQRTAVLAMKMASIDVYEYYLGAKPLLLLDDVMSELDDRRQKAVMEIVIKKKIQTFITSTGMDFTFHHFGYDPVFVIHEGKIVPKEDA